MTIPSGEQVLARFNDLHDRLADEPMRLRDIRARAASLAAFAANTWPRRAIYGEIARIVQYYYPLPEMIALYRQDQDIYREHLENGELSETNPRHVLIADAHGLCWIWMDPRYPYGDVRLLRPIIGEVLIASADWERNPCPEEAAALGTWYEQLAPGGELYPTDEHLDYVRRFEAFAEDIVWNGKDQEFITISNFPAPPNAVPADKWWHVQHIPR